MAIPISYCSSRQASFVTGMSALLLDSSDEPACTADDSDMQLAAMLQACSFD